MGFGWQLWNIYKLKVFQLGVLPPNHVRGRHWAILKHLRLLRLKFTTCYLRTNTNQRTCFMITPFIQAISSLPVTSGNNDPATSKKTSPESKRPVIHNCMVTPRKHEMSISIILYSMALMSYCGNKLLISMSNPTCMSVLENIEKKLTPKGSSKLYCYHQVSTSDYLQLIFISRCFCSMY